MDPITAIGTAASIVQLVQVGAQLSIQFYTIGKQIKNAPKIFEEISNEVASTSTILQLLSSELDDQSRLKLHKPAAVQKTRELMAECSAIYEALIQKITPNVKHGASDRAKARAALMKRLKMPYMTDEFAELRNKLMGVKTWLNMMLSTLNLGIQAKGFSGSQEAKDLLLEQRQMLEMLVQETRLLHERTSQSTISSDKPDQLRPVTKDDSTIKDSAMSLVNASSTSLSSSMLTLVDTNAAKENVYSTPDASASNHASGQRNLSTLMADNTDPPTMPKPANPLPKELVFYAKEIREQARLITDLVDMIDRRSYAISKKTRSSMHEQTLNTHLVQWKRMAEKHGYKYFVSMVEDFPDLLENWSAEMFQVEEKSPGEKNDSAVSISHRRTSEMPIRLPVSSEEKVSNAADERLANSDRPSTLSNQKKIGAVNVEEEFRRDLKERMERAGNSSDYIEDVLEGKKASRINSQRTDTHQLALDMSRPTYIRVQEKHLLPETLDYYKLPWEYDNKDRRYVIIKQYISHEFQEELFRHTKQIYQQREMGVIPGASVKGTVEPSTTVLKPRPSSKRDNMYLVRKKRSRDRSPLRHRSWLFTEDIASSQPASVAKKVSRFSDEEIAEYEEVFKLFDKAGTGFVTQTEIVQINLSLGQNVTTEELAGCLERAKIEDPHKISFQDFLRTMEYQRKDNFDETKEASKIFDNDNQESITAVEHHTAMRSSGDDAGDKEIEDMVKEVDHGDGKIDYEEFSQILSKQNSPVKDKAQQPLPPFLSKLSISGRQFWRDRPASRPIEAHEPTSENELAVSNFSKARHVDLDDLSQASEHEATYDEEEKPTFDVSKDVEDLLREYTLLDEDELKLLQT